MDSKSILGVVLAFGVAFSLLAGSGIGAAVFGEDPDSAKAGSTLDDITEESQVDPEEGEGSGGLAADVAGDNEPTIVGVAISGGRFAATLVASVTLLPLTLTSLGFPLWFAFPIGGVAQIIAFIGLIQFVRGNEYI
jgi:hypothetical protein